MRERTNKKDPSRKDPHTVVRAIAFSCLVGAITLAAVLLVFSLVLASKNIPHMAITPMVIVAIVLCGGSAGFTCARLCRERGLFYGTICGLLMGVVLMISGTIMGRSFYMPTFPQLLLLLFSGAIGGVLGVNMRRK